MKKEITFVPAYHRCSQDPKQDFGIGCVRIVWALEEDGDTIYWELFTDWTMEPTVFHEACPDCKHPAHKFGMPPGRTMAGGVTLHLRKPMYVGKEPSCEECPEGGGPCWRDISYSLGDEVFKILVTKGSEGVWEFLHERLKEVP